MSDPSSALTRDDMLALLESGRELGSPSHLDSLLERIMAKAGNLTNSADTSVILCHPDRTRLYVAAASGAKADWVLATFGKHSAKSIPVEGSKAGRVFATGISLVENRLDDHFRGVDEETKTTTESMVCVPLGTGEGIFGVMQILNKRSGDYEDRDRQLIEHFASQAAAALVNAQLMESALAHSGCYVDVAGTTPLEEILREICRPAHLEKLSVLFADMRGFTRLCQSLGSPTEIQSKLNEFLSMLAGEVLAAEGMVNKFLGDGLMAIFRHDDHAQRAVNAAFRMVGRFSEIKAAWNDASSEQLDFLDVGVGIATGEVMLGGIGSEKVRDFTAIGVATNLAAAFVKDARGGRHIIANHLTYQLAKDGVKSEPLEDFLLQKPDQPTGIKHKRYLLQESRRERVFLSHSHADREWVERYVVGPLRDQGVEVWYAPDEIRKAATWPAEIRRGLAKCTCMLVVVSENSAGSDWVRLEVDLAFGMKSMLHRIIPLCLDETPPHDVNSYLLATHGINVPNSPGYPAEILRFIRGGK